MTWVPGEYEGVEYALYNINSWQLIMYCGYLKISPPGVVMEVADIYIIFIESAHWADSI